MLMLRAEAPVSRRTGTAIAQAPMRPVEKPKQKNIRVVLYQSHERRLVPSTRLQSVRDITLSQLNSRTLPAMTMKIRGADIKYIRIRVPTE